MFIEKLWEENPELVIKAIKKIYNVREEKGDSLKFEKFENGILSFIKYGHDCHSIHLSDFGISSIYLIPYKSDTIYAKQWIKFMYKVYGEEYIEEYITYRNNQLDEFMAEYEKNYTNETINVLANLGIKKYQDMQNQTK